MPALDRILSTPLKADRTSVRVASDGYHVATVSKHMNDPEDYARLFAASPDLLKAVKDLWAFASVMVARHGMDGDDTMTDADHEAWQNAGGGASVAVAKAEGVS